MAGPSLDLFIHRRKPLERVAVNRDHPLARGLIFATLPGSRGGILDLAGPHGLATLTAPQWKPGQDGMGFYSPYITSGPYPGYSWTNPSAAVKALATNGAALSALVIGAPVYPGAWNDTYVLDLGASGSGYPNSLFSVDWANNSNGRCVKVSAFHSSAVSMQGHTVLGALPPTTTWPAYMQTGFTFTQGSIQASFAGYVQGQLVSWIWDTAPSVGLVTDQPSGIYTLGASSSSAQVSAQLVWNRTLSAAEFEWLYAEPMSLFKEAPQRQSYFTMFPASVVASMVVSPGTLPSNHNGNITLSLVGTNTSWTAGTTFTVGGVAGWAKVSQSVTDGTHATVVVSCPAVATPPAGSTGTLSISDGSVTGATTVGTPSFTVTPNTDPAGSGAVSVVFAGTNTLWQVDDPQFTASALSGSSIGTSTATNNTSSSATLTVGSTAGTITITDPSTGATQSFSVTTVAPGSVLDPNVFFSPFNWYSDGTGSLMSNGIHNGSTYAMSGNPGAYIKLKFTGTGITLNYDNTPYGGVANNYPTITWSVDNGALSTALLASADAGAKPLASGLTDATHTITIWFKNRNNNLSGSASPWDWSTTNSALKITSFTIAGAAPATSSVTLRSKRLLVLGDSITEGNHAAQGDTNTADALSTYAFHLAEALQAEVGVVGFGGTGWLQAAGGVPTFHTIGTAASQSWQWYSLNKSRLVSGAFYPDPDYIVIVHGTNDGIQSSVDASVTAAAHDFLVQMEAAAPTAKVFLVLPFGRFKKTALSAVAIPSTNMTYVDLDANSPADQLLAIGLGNSPSGDSTGAWGAASGVISGTASRRAGDGLHPNSLTHGEAAARLVDAIMSFLQPAGGGGGGGSSSIGSRFLRRSFR